MRWPWTRRRPPSPRGGLDADGWPPPAGAAGELVERVALDLYARALSAGGWTLDLGVFGPRLFVSDARDVLWAIALGRAHGDPPVP